MTAAHTAVAGGATGGVPEGMKNIALLLALICPLAAAAADDAASKFVNLAAQSDVVAVGTCMTAESAWDEPHRLIVTTVQFHPTRYLKGAAGDAVTIRVLGGSVGNDSMRASHAATLSAGENALLFLSRSQFGPYFVIAGGEGGKLPISVDAATGTPYIGATLSIDAFSHSIDAAGVR